MTWSYAAFLSAVRARTGTVVQRVRARGRSGEAWLSPST